MIRCLFQGGGDCSGDEEEASRQEGCAEEKEVTTDTTDYAGGGTPQRDSYSILSFMPESRYIMCFLFVQIKHIVMLITLM